MVSLVVASLFGSPPALAQEQPPATSIRFTDVTAQSGIAFRHHNGMEDGYKQIPEDEGAGAAWLDYDLDGDLDLYLVQSNRLPGLEPNPEWTSALYRNNGDGTFTDVTAGTPLGTVGYGQGAAVGDYDNDGDPDLYVTFIGPNRLFRNDGGGAWTDVSQEAGVDDPAWGTSAAFFDYDLDGDLDLFVVRYIQWSFDNLKNADRMIDGKLIKLYVRPAEYKPTPDLLYRNNGDGTFTDVSQEAGITFAGNGFVGLTFDYDRDGHPDIYVANDMMENWLYRNRGDGTFEEVGLVTGAGYGGMGEIQNGMGGSLGDCDNDGWLDIMVSHHQGEPCALYRNREGQYFDYISDQSGVGRATFGVLSWGNVFADFDNDGDLDLFIANGHVETAEEALPAGVTCKQPDMVLANDGRCNYTDVSAQCGPYFQERHWSRAVAAADYDNDGDVDVLVTVNDGTPVLLRNDTAPGHHWLRFRLVGTKSNRDALGARVEVTAGGRTQVREVRHVDGYCASHDPAVHFGLGAAVVAEEVTVHWLHGTQSVLKAIPADQVVTIEESPIRTGSVPSESLDAVLAAARDLVSCGSWVPAVEQLQQAARRYPDDPRPYASLAHVLHASGEPAAAMDACVASLSISPTTRAWNNALRMLFDREEYQSAVYAATRSLNLDATQAETWTHLARIHRKRGLLAQSEECYRRALQLDGDRLSLREEYALFLLDTSTAEKAHSVADQLLSDRPDSCVARLVLGRILQMEGQPQAALDMLPYATETVGNAALVNLLRGEALLALKHYQAAEAYLVQVTRTPGHAHLAHFALSRVYRALERPDLAAWHADQFRETKRTDEEARKDTVPELLGALGQRIDEGDLDGSLPLLRRALTLHPDCGELHLLCAYCLIRAGSPAEASSHLTLGERLSPFSIDHYTNLGAAFALMGNSEVARACWEKALFLDPTTVPALRNLATLEGQYSVAYLVAKGVGPSTVEQYRQSVEGLSSGLSAAYSPQVANMAESATSPVRGALLFSVALQQALKREWAQALAALDLAAESLGWGPKLLFYRCTIVRALGDEDQADALAKALGLKLADPVFGPSDGET